MDCLNILTVSQINTLQTGCFMYQILNGLLPKTLFGDFSKNSDKHNYFTRNRNNLYILKHHTKKREESIHISGVKMWNALPNSVKSAANVVLFKKQLKILLLNN